MKKTLSILAVCLFSVAAMAQQVRVLSNQKVADGWNPRFSADSKELLYTVEEAAEVPAEDVKGDLYVANEDLEMVLYRNGERKVLTPHGTDVNYIWISLSPDKQKILFNTLHGTAVCDLTGKELVNLGNLNAPVWYGNDKVVGMLDTHDGYYFTSSCIAIRSLDGKLNQQLTDPKDFGMYPTVSVETGMIAYNTLRGEVKLLKTDLAGSGEITTPVVRKVTPKMKPRRATAAKYTGAGQVKIYINPGHGGYDSDDRPMHIYPFAQNAHESFWESVSNLDKGLKLNEWLQREGFQTKMSRTQNRTEDDRALSAIVAEANAYDADFMLSIHSNAGGPSNYVLELYAGQDADDTHKYPNVPPCSAESRAISSTIAKYLVSNQITTWAPQSRVDGWVVGDKTFGRNIMGWSDGYGVLRKLAVPGVISEGCMHDYIPETYRLMNMDYKWRESFYFMAAFCEYFLDYTLPYGAIGGQVRDWYQKLEFPKITTIRDSRDALLPIHRAKVTLLQDGKELATYTTDTLYNGVYFFWDLKPGKYTVRTEAEHYYPMEEEVEVVAGDIVYQDMLINAKRETRPEVISYSPAVANLTDSVDVSTEIVLNFNWDMKEEETTAAFSITPDVEGTIIYENSYRTLRFKPDRMLEPEVEYTVTLAKSACHPDFSYPNTMAEDFVMKFRTRNRSNLKIVSSYPFDGSTEVPLNPSFIIVLDERVNTSTAKGDNLSVVDSEGNVQSINTRLFKYNTLGTAYGFVSFELVNALQPDKEYKFIIGPNVKDVLGIYHNTTTAITFRTTSENALTMGSLVDNMDTLSFKYDADNSLYVNNASVFLNTTKKYANIASNELKYDFSDAEGVAMYHYKASLFNGNGNCKLGMYVFSDFSQNELQAVWDAQGDIKYTPVCTLDYAGWHYEEVDMNQLPTDVDYQFMGLRLVRKDGILSQSGSIFIDNMYYERQEPTNIGQLLAPGISVYPNPANTKVMVAGLDAPASLSLFTVDGKVVRETAGYIMPVADVAEGLYMLNIQTAEGNKVVRVLVAH